MIVKQLRGFLSRQPNSTSPDKQIAECLKHAKLTLKLDDSAIEDIQSLGAGPKAAKALKVPGASTKDLPRQAELAPEIAAKPISPPDFKEQAEVLKDATEYALLCAKNLPNFLCMKVTAICESHQGPH